MSDMVLIVHIDRLINEQDSLILDSAHDHSRQSSADGKQVGLARIGRYGMS